MNHNVTDKMIDAFWKDFPHVRDEVDRDQVASAIASALNASPCEPAAWTISCNGNHVATTVERPTFTAADCDGTPWQVEALYRVPNGGSAGSVPHVRPEIVVLLRDGVRAVSRNDVMRGGGRDFAFERLAETAFALLDQLERSNADQSVVPAVSDDPITDGPHEGISAACSEEERSATAPSLDVRSVEAFFRERLGLITDEEDPDFWWQPASGAPSDEASEMGSSREVLERLYQDLDAAWGLAGNAENRARLAEEVLSWYATPQNWRNGIPGHPDDDLVWVPDNGNRARTTSSQTDERTVQRYVPTSTGYVEAVRYVPGDTCDVLVKWTGADPCDEGCACDPDISFCIDERQEAVPGDWVVRHVDGTLDVVNETTFLEIYRPLGNIR